MRESTLIKYVRDVKESDMCVHVYQYPPDTRENYNPDGKTLTGVCKCGAKEKSYGVRWSIGEEERFLYTDPYGDTSTYIDKSRIMC